MAYTCHPSTQEADAGGLLIAFLKKKKQICMKMLFILVIEFLPISLNFLSFNPGPDSNG